MKTCSQCGQSKPLHQFSRHSRSKDGHRSNCKECAAEYNRQWHAANADHKRAYHLAKREHRLRVMSDYRQRNGEALRAYDRERQQRERDKRNAYLRQYYRDNIDLRREYNRENAERNRANQHRRRTIKREYRSQPEDVEYMRLLRGDLCAYCGGPAGTIDHIDPLRKGSDGRWINLTAACLRCNSSKNALSLLTFLLRS